MLYSAKTKKNFQSEIDLTCAMFSLQWIWTIVFWVSKYDTASCVRNTEVSGRRWRVNSKLNSVWELSWVVLQQEVVVFGLDVALYYTWFTLCQRRWTMSSRTWHTAVLVSWITYMVTRIRTVVNMTANARITTNRQRLNLVWYASGTESKNIRFSVSYAIVCIAFLQRICRAQWLCH